MGRIHKQAGHVIQVKGFPNEVVDPQTGKGSVDRFLAVRAGNNNFEIGPYAARLLQDLPA
jgi:hypothetical protein